MEKIILTSPEPSIGATSEDLANIIVNRMGVMPRKKGATEKMNQVLLELYERTKAANRDKNPRAAVMTVEEMAGVAGITRQTMYDYLKRWLVIDMLTKTSYIDGENKAIIGYRLNGTTIESAFDKAKAKINNNLELTTKYIQELQRVVKNEKLSKKSQKFDGNASAIAVNPEEKAEIKVIETDNNV